VAAGGWGEGCPVASDETANAHHHFPLPAKGKRRDGGTGPWPREQEETAQIKICHPKTNRAEDPTDGPARIARDDIDRQSQEDGDLNKRYDHEAGRASDD
jgi:hypothetical protein